MLDWSHTAECHFFFTDSILFNNHNNSVGMGIFIISISKTDAQLTCSHASCLCYIACKLTSKNLNFAISKFMILAITSKTPWHNF